MANENFKQEFDKIRKEIEEKVQRGKCYALERDYSRIFYYARACVKLGLVDENDRAFLDSLYNFTHYPFMKITLQDIKDFLKTQGVDWQGFYMDYYERYYPLTCFGFDADGYKKLFHKAYNAGNVKNTQHDYVYIIVNIPHTTENLIKCENIENLKVVKISDYDFKYYDIQPNCTPEHEDKLTLNKDFSTHWRKFLTKRYPELALVYTDIYPELEMPEMTPELIKTIIGEPKFISLEQNSNHQV